MTTTTDITHTELGSSRNTKRTVGVVAALLVIALGAAITINYIRPTPAEQAAIAASAERKSLSKDIRIFALDIEQALLASNLNNTGPFIGYDDSSRGLTPRSSRSITLAYAALYDYCINGASQPGDPSLHYDSSLGQVLTGPCPKAPTTG